MGKKDRVSIDDLNELNNLIKETAEKWVIDFTEKKNLLDRQKAGLFDLVDNLHIFDVAGMGKLLPPKKRRDICFKNTSSYKKFFRSCKEEGLNWDQKLNIEGYQFQYDKENKIININASGEWDESKFPHGLDAFLSEIIKHNCQKVLVDYRNIEITSNVSTLNKRPILFKQKTHTHNLVGAFVSREKTDKISIIKDAYLKHGFTVKLFTNIDKAFSWLCEQPCSV